MTRLLPVLFILCVACEYNDSRAIPYKIIARVYPETFGSNHIYMICETETYFAKPRTIDQQASIGATSITIKFTGFIDYATTVLNAPPATCIIDLGELDFKTYDVEFINGDHRDFGKLEVKDIGVLLTIPKSNAIEASKPTMDY